MLSVLSLPAGPAPVVTALDVLPARQADAPVVKQAPAQAPAEVPAQGASAPSPQPTAIALPGGDAIPLQALPQSVDAIVGLRQRREELRVQLERAGNRRQNLVEQLSREGDAALPTEARTGIQQRLNLLDERILQIERDQAMTERLLSNAPLDLLAQSRSQENVYTGPRVDEDEAVAAAFGAFGGGIVLTILIGRWRRRRAAKRGGKPATALPADDPRMDVLQQSVEAMAVELERIGEGQRFVTQLLSTRNEQSVLRGGAEPPYRA